MAWNAVRAAYRDVCSGQFSAGVPFTKLLFDLAIRGNDDGPVGQVATPDALVQDSLFEINMEK